MTFPWKGAAKRLAADAFELAALRLGCDVNAIKAVWEVEAAGRPFLDDGSLIRRFEPHKMPKETWAAIGFDPNGKKPWRASLAIKIDAREAMMQDAYHRFPEETLAASSYGGPQIMGFNWRASGFKSVRDMVKQMAADETAQLEAFINLVTSWGLDSALRAQDWLTIEKRYNGGGFGGKYARKMEKVFRRLSGKASPQVLRLGASGSSVKRLQTALGLTVDGRFGTDTHAAVEQFQREQGLKVDGVVGRKTWDAISAAKQVAPVQQGTDIDDIIEKLSTPVVGGGSLIGLVTALGGWFVENAPAQAVEILFTGGVSLFLAGIAAAGAVYVIRRVRRVA